MSVFKRIKNIIKSNVGGLMAEREVSSEPVYSYEDFSYNSFTEDSPDINPTNNQESQYYANLELKDGASYDKIKQSYKNLLKKYHPDLHNKNSEDRMSAEKITRKLNEAFNYFEDKFNRGELK